MQTFNQKEIKEINHIIKQIEEQLKPTCEVGARERTTLTALLNANKIEKKLKFFACKKEYSEAIVTHFVKEKGIARNKFSMNMQSSVFLAF